MASIPARFTRPQLTRSRGPSRWPVTPQSSSSHRPITRRSFGAYVPDLWLVQYYLSELGYDPGGLDGLWGSRTQAAAQAFSDEWGTGQGTIDLNVAVAGSNLFGGALRRAARDAGLDMTIVPPSSGPGGSGVRPEAGGTQTVAFEPETIIGKIPGGSMGLMAFGLIGVGAFLIFKKR
jgi:hypothetical protein